MQNQFLTLFKVLKPKLLSDSFQIVDTCDFALFASLSTLQLYSYYFLIVITAFADSHEEFPSVPKVQPSLGLKAGHARRDIAAARKPRPPSRKITAAEQQVSLERCRCYTALHCVLHKRGALSRISME